MVTDTACSKMMSDVAIRSMMLKNPDYGEDLSMLIREQRRREAASERERELSMYRSGSAPPTVEGSLSAVGALFDSSSLGFAKSGGGGNGGGGGRSFMSEEELRADPAYANYYYSNVNLNPRLPPPMVSKEDWRFTQRIGDSNRRNGDSSLFSVQPAGFDGKKENGVRNSVAEWGGNGLIGMPPLGLGNRQKSIAKLIKVRPFIN